MGYAVIRRLNMTVPSMTHPGRVTVYIVGVAQLSCLVALPGVRTYDIPKISKEARKVNRFGRSYQQILSACLLFLSIEYTFCIVYQN